MVFSIFCVRFIIFEQVICPQQKCEAGFLLLIDCSVVVLGETIALVIEVIYVPFKNVCMSLFYEVMMFE
jgi:hypothetical protein